MINKLFKSSLTKFYFTNIPKQFFSAEYDCVVIGGGPGGYVSAIKAGQLGLKTACIEKRGSLGGTCLNVGCIPSKALLNISQKYEDATKHFKNYGLHVKGVDINWEEVQSKKTKIVNSLTGGIEGLFKKNKVDYIKGWGKLTSQNEINVDLNAGGKQQVKAKNIILATGSEPIAFPGLPFDEKVIISSTGALSLGNIPKEMIVIGGGVIGLELGQVYQRFGTKVTVVEFLDRICFTADAEVSKKFQQILTKQGIKILAGHKVTGGKNLGDSAELYIQPVKGGETTTLKADNVLVATGRKPYSEGLGAKEIGVKYDEKGRVFINKNFQTNFPNIYAIGDLVAGPMLAHKAEEEGIAAVEFISKQAGHVNYNAIPSVIYTHPELAWVGKTEEELKQAGISFNKGSFPFLANSRAKANDDTDGFIKVLSDKQTDKILGIHILGAGAGEMIAEAVLGVEYGASSEDLGRTCHAHPTLSEALKEACMAAYDKPIHF